MLGMCRLSVNFDKSSVINAAAVRDEDDIDEDCDADVGARDADDDGEEDDVSPKSGTKIPSANPKEKAAITLKIHA